MRTYAALLRGINVAGHGTVKMEVLRALFVDLGHSDVTSYVQSGNIVFRSPRSGSSALRRSIEDRVRTELGLDVTVLLRSDDDLQLVLRTNPFLGRTEDLATLHVTFLADVPAAGANRGAAHGPRGRGAQRRWKGGLPVVPRRLRQVEAHEHRAREETLHSCHHPKLEDRPEARRHDLVTVCARRQSIAATPARNTTVAKKKKLPATSCHPRS